LADDSAARDVDQQAIKDALDKGLSVELNDSGEVVDERSLLAPGLNILPKRAPPAALPSASGGSSKGPGTSGYVPSRRVGEASSAREIKARTDALLRAQFAEEQERQRRLEVVRDAAREVGVKEKRNDEAAVGSARQRFEERKRRKLEEEAAAREKAKEQAAAGGPDGRGS
jgi:coiled-coil domain-containing protein 55